jgi:hypothetical protein
MFPHAQDRNRLRTAGFPPDADPRGPRGMEALRDECAVCVVVDRNGSGARPPIDAISKDGRMQTIKTAVVVVLLLTVLYGAYVAISDTGTPLPMEVAEWVEADPDLEVDFPVLASTDRSGSPGMASLGSPRLADSSRGENGSATGGRLVGATQLPPAWPGNPGGPVSGSQGVGGESPSRAPATASSGRPTDRDGMLSDRAGPMMPQSSSDPMLGWDAPPLSAQSGGGSRAASAGRLSDSQEDWESALAPERDPATARDTLSAAPTAAQPLASAGRLDSGHASEMWPGWLGDAPPGASSSAFSDRPAADRPASERESVAGASGSVGSSSDSAAVANIEAQLNDLGSSPDSYVSPVGRSFENAKRSAMELIGRGDLKQALATLSFFYSEPELTDRQLRDLIEILDPLAGEVIYSRGHYLGPSYRATPTDRLVDVAKKYDVPPEILAAINALPSIDAPLHGRELKVLPGPFRAELDLSRGELTMFLGELYAGRFPVSLGGDPEPRPGMYQVVEKQRNRNYYGEGGNLVAGEHPRNPYGGYWMDLGAGMCIHGSPALGGADGEELGCISLSPMDARDIFGMLGRGSKVLIRE